MPLFKLLATAAPTSLIRAVPPRREIASIVFDLEVEGNRRWFERVSKQRRATTPLAANLLKGLVGAQGLEPWTR
jgi:hypothetical protein